MGSNGSTALLIICTTPFFACAADPPQQQVAEASPTNQKAIVGEALSIVEVKGPVTVVSSEGWWGSGVLHVRDGNGIDRKLPYGFFPGEDSCRLSDEFLRAEYPTEPARAECAWIILLEDWMRREFSEARIRELESYDGRDELTEKESAALWVVYLLNDPESPIPAECLSQ